MKRIFLFLTFALALFGMAKADEVLVQQCLFGSSNNSKGNSAYTETWTATNNGFTWEIANFNNNNNAWNGQIKCGRKGNASVATITTTTAISNPISTVSIQIDAITASSINSITLATSTDGFMYRNVGTFNQATGEQKVTLSTPTANLYYKISFDCASASSNGPLTLSAVSYYEMEDEETAQKADPELSYGTDEVSVELGGSYTLPTLSYATDGKITYTSEKEAVATVNESGVVEVKGAGTTTITASAEESDKYKAGTVSYSLTVIDPNDIFTDISADFFNHTGNSYKAADDTTDDYGVTYSAVYYYSNGMQFNTNNSNGKGSGIAVVGVSDDYIISSIDIEMDELTNSNGLKVYKSGDAFKSLTTTGTPSVTGATQVNSDLIKNSTTGIEINDKAFAIHPSTTGAIVVKKVTVHYAKNVIEPKDYEALNVYDDDEITFELGDSYQLELGEEHPTISYEYAPDDVITIDEDGKITASKACEEVIVEASWGDDEWNEGSVMFTVKVTEPVMEAPTTITFNPEAGDITVNTPITLSADGTLVTITYKVDDDEEENAYEEGEELYLNMGHHTLYVTASNSEGSVTAEATYFVAAVATAPSITATVDLTNQEDLAYGNGKEITWVSTDEKFEFSTIAIVGSGKNTYPTGYSNGLRIYSSNGNEITVNAPEGYMFKSASATSSYNVAVDGNEIASEESYTFTEPVASFVLTSANSSTNPVSSMTFTLVGELPSITVHPGADNTVQSGEVKNSTITMQSLEETVWVYINVPSNIKVQYVNYEGGKRKANGLGTVPEAEEYQDAEFHAENEDGTHDYKVELTTGSNGSLYLKYINDDDTESATHEVYAYTVTLDVPTGVESIGSEDGEAVYFNLQGQKVANPERGIYVKVQNGKATKIVK